MASTQSAPGEAQALPELPKPYDLQYDYHGRPQVLFTADQMRAYAKAALALPSEPEASPTVPRRPRVRRSNARRGSEVADSASARERHACHGNGQASQEDAILVARYRDAALGARPAPDGGAPSEFGWLIEHSGKVRGVPNGSLSWLYVRPKLDGFGKELGFTNDASKALRFSRKEDAEAVLSMHLGISPPAWYSAPLSVTEHYWPSPLAARQAPDLAEPSGGIESGPEEERIEAAYWRFDARHKGYGQWKQAPMSERDAFKAEMRNALGAEKIRAEMRLVAKGWRRQAPGFAEEARAQLQHLVDDLTHCPNPDDPTKRCIRPGAGLLFSNMVNAVVRLLAARPAPDAVRSQTDQEQGQ